MVLAQNLVNLKMNIITIETVKHYGPKNCTLLRILEHCVNFDAIRPANNIIDNNNAGVFECRDSTTFINRVITTLHPFVSGKFCSP